MMRLTKPTTDAVKVLAYLAQSPDATVSVSAIAQACGMTEKTAFKLVPTLVRKGFAQTERGRTGGVKLARPAEAISLGEIVRALEEAPAGFGDSAHSQPLSLIVDEAYGGFLQILDQHSVADFARNKGNALNEPAPSNLGFVT
ncbi:MAG: Rrf2 family transcriptional regulator [Pseudomonadota bacterium]